MHATAHANTTTQGIEPLLTVNEVCAALGVTRSTVYKLVREHELVPTFVGSRARFEPEEIRNFIQRHRRDHLGPDAESDDDDGERILDLVRAAIAERRRGK